jgi:hypothetical protein
VGSWGSDLQLLSDKDDASFLPVLKIDNFFWLDEIFRRKLLERSLLRERDRQKGEDVLIGLLWHSLPLDLVALSVPSDNQLHVILLDSSDISSMHNEFRIIASEVTLVRCVMGKSSVCMKQCVMGNVSEDASGISVQPWALCCVVLSS